LNKILQETAHQNEIILFFVQNVFIKNIYISSHIHQGKQEMVKSFYLGNAEQM
jgi:hypothetical protein